MSHINQDQDVHRRLEEVERHLKDISSTLELVVGALNSLVPRIEALSNSVYKEVPPTPTKTTVHINSKQN